MVGPGSDAAVVRVKGTRKALAMAVDGNGRYCWLDPYEGARLAVAEACRNVAAARGGADRRHQLPQLRQPREARGDGPARDARSAAWATPAAPSGVPITGGNVSLYNETDGQAIYPTPVLGVVGLLEDAVAGAAPLVPARRRRRLPAGRDRATTWAAAST